jgi:hypothetical protein
VRPEGFLAHQPAEPYDDAMIYAVIEHLPKYRRFVAKAWDVLKPSGRLYPDASASIRRGFDRNRSAMVASSWSVGRPVVTTHQDPSAALAIVGEADFSGVSTVRVVRCMSVS